MTTRRAIALRGVAALSLTIIVVVALAGVSSSAGGFTRRKAPKLFYTKAQADARFAPASQQP